MRERDSWGDVAKLADKGAIRPSGRVGSAVGDYKEKDYVKSESSFGTFQRDPKTYGSPEDYS